MPRPNEHPYLTGNYAPVPDETSITDLAVDGEIPLALHGRYLQIGPNPIGNPARPYVWSEADAMVHAITIRPGHTPSYRNRWVITAHASTLLGTEPVPGEVAGATDMANAILLVAGDRILALSEHAAYELGPDLETRRRVLVSRDLWQVAGGPDRPASRYVYALGRTGDLPFAGTEIFEHRLATGATEQRNPGALRHPGGFVFVGDPARRNHDDGGWHVGLVHVENTALAELVVLDANEPHSPALATVHITRRVPYGPYCTWAPAPSTPRER